MGLWSLVVLFFFSRENIFRSKFQDGSDHQDHITCLYMSTFFATIASCVGGVDRVGFSWRLAVSIADDLWWSISLFDATPEMKVTSMKDFFLGNFPVDTVDGRNPKQPPGMYKTL